MHLVYMSVNQLVRLAPLADDQCLKGHAALEMSCLLKLVNASFLFKTSKSSTFIQNSVYGKCAFFSFFFFSSVLP